MTPQSPFNHLPTHDRTIEAAVLGAALQEATALRHVMDKLGARPETFYHPAHKAIFQAMLELFRAGLDIDCATVIHQLTRMGKLAAAGGAAEVTKIMISAISMIHIETHCLLLLEFYCRRRIISAMQRGLKHAYYQQEDVMELLTELQMTINDLNASMQLTKPKYVHEILPGVLTSIVKATDGPKGIPGVPSGLRELDNVTGGWQNSDLIIIAARPGMGKTSLMVALAMNAASVGKRGVIFTMEVNSDQLTLKMVAREAGYTTNQLRRGLFDGGLAEAYALNEKVAPLRNMGVIIDDTTELTLGALRAKATQLKAEEGIEWLAIDYMQFMTISQKGHSREQEISAISRGLKRLAKELDIPVIALAQLSRDVEKRGGVKRPQLSDLRDSGAIEQDADLIIFPYRPEYYGITQDDKGNSTVDVTELIIAKHRNGSTADVWVRSVMKFGRYEDL